MHPMVEKAHEAIASFTKAIEIDPNNAIAFSLRSLTNFQAGNDEEALADCNRAIKLEPNIAGHYRIKADCLISLKRYSEALVCFQQVLKLEPNDTQSQEKINILLNAMNKEPLLSSPLLSSLYQLKRQIDQEFQPFEEDRTAGILDSKRKETVDIMGPICKQSTSLVENISTNDLPLEARMLYSYIQAVGRGCNSVHCYVDEDRSSEMRRASKDCFNQAEKIAENREDLEMLKDINSKRGALMFAFYKTWNVKDFLDVASQSYQWLDLHPETTNSQEKQLIQERLTKIKTALSSNQNSHVSSSQSSNLDYVEESNFKEKPRLEISPRWMLGIGAFGIVLLFSGQWLIGLICIIVAFFMWRVAF